MRKSWRGEEGQGAPAVWTAHVETDSTQEREVPGAGRQGQQREGQNELEKDLRWSKTLPLWNVLARLRSISLSSSATGDQSGRLPSRPAWHGKRILEGNRRSRENKEDITTVGRMKDNI